MAKRNNHYEAAFEAWLRCRQIPYVAVDETRRALAGERSLKNLDFIVSPQPAASFSGCPALQQQNCASAPPTSWLVDVKGRRFPTGKGQYWKNWVTNDELRSLASWETLFGGRFSGLLVFAYNVIGDVAPLPAEQLFPFRDGLYGFVGIRLDHYASWAQQLSVRWDTVSIPVPKFRVLARGAESFFSPPPHPQRGAA